MTILTNEECSVEISKLSELESDELTTEPVDYTCDNRDEKEKEKKDGKLFPLSKIVVRRLPPTMTKDQFMDQVSPLPEFDYIYFAKADLSLGQSAFSRVYINFLNEDDIITFTEKFDGYVFVDQKGNDYPAVVEYAPFQKVPKNRNRKKDSKSGTIEQDPDYLKFLEALQNPEEVTLPSAETCLEEIEAKERELKANNGVPKVITPLIEFVKLKKAEKQRIKEERREERKRRELERRKSKEEERRKFKEAKERVIKEKEKKMADKKFVERKEKKEDKDHKDSQIVKLLKKPEDDKSDREDSNEDASRKQAAAIIKSSDKSKESEKKTRKEEDKKCKERKERKKDAKMFKDKSDRTKYTKDKQELLLDREIGSVGDGNIVECSATMAKDDYDCKEMGDNNDKRKDPRSQRRIRNKDRPSLEIYRPGMRRLKAVQPCDKNVSGRDFEQDLSPSRSSSPSPTFLKNKFTDIADTCSLDNNEKMEEDTELMKLNDIVINDSETENTA